MAAVLIWAPVHVGSVLPPRLFNGRPSGRPESRVLSQLARLRRKNRPFSANLSSNESS